MWPFVAASPCSNRCLIDADAVVFAFAAEAIDFRSQVCCSRSRCSNKCAPIRVAVGCWVVCLSAVARRTVDVRPRPECCAAMDADSA